MCGPFLASMGHGFKNNYRYLFSLSFTMILREIAIMVLRGRFQRFFQSICITNFDPLLLVPLCSTSLNLKKYDVAEERGFYYFL